MGLTGSIDLGLIDVKLEILFVNIVDYFFTMDIADRKAMVIAQRAVAVKRVTYFNLFALGLLPYSVSFFALPSLNLSGGYHGLQPSS